MRIAIVSDAWFPQINGVGRTLAATVAELDCRGFEVELITPQGFLTVPMPGYASIRLALAPRFGARRTLHRFAPDIVHIVTEGPIGWSARGWCLSRGVPFTSAFHTRFPDYAEVRTGISAERFWPLMRCFHGPSGAVLVATPSLARELAERGIEHARPWTRGIDNGLFHPRRDPHPALAALPHPIMLNVGRVAAEKNLEAFLELPVAGSKVIVGDGPAMRSLRTRFPNAHFLGPLEGEELASAYCGADCFVFPSRTDTFGLVLLEALACGLPLAAYPVAGPLDIVGAQGRGPEGELPRPIAALDEDLANAIARAVMLDRDDAADFSRRFTWQHATDLFVDALSSTAARRLADVVSDAVQSSR
ncbi:MAG: glycosyltransferase family 1 protein [Novosphingobium sp.]